MPTSNKNVSVALLGGARTQIKLDLEIVRRRRVLLVHKIVPVYNQQPMLKGTQGWYYNKIWSLAQISIDGFLLATRCCMLRSQRWVKAHCCRITFLLIFLVLLEKQKKGERRRKRDDFPKSGNLTEDIKIGMLRFPFSGNKIRKIRNIY